MGLVGGPQSGLGRANVEVPARHRETTGHRSLGFIEKSRMEIDVWEMTLKMSYDGEGKGCVDGTWSSPRLEVRTRGEPARTLQRHGQPGKGRRKRSGMEFQ